MTKPRLILHIGSHKTGTTAIQRFCGKHRDALFQQGILYPSYDLVQEKEHYAHLALAHGIAGLDERWPKEKIRLFMGKAAALCPEGGSVMLSAEPLFRHLIVVSRKMTKHLPDREYWLAKRRYIEAVAEVLQDFDVEVVAVFRNQNQYFGSLYQELIKVTRFSGTPFEFYLMKRHELNYFDQMEMWSACFPKVRVLVFEQLCQRGELVHEFLKIVSGKDLVLPAVADRVNTSLHPLIIETKRRFNMLPQNEGMGRVDIREELEQLQKFAFAKRLISPVSRHSYLTDGEWRFLSLSCRSSNRALRQAYFPEEGTELENSPAPPPSIDVNDAKSQKIVNKLLARLLKILKS